MRMNRPLRAFALMVALFSPVLAQAGDRMALVIGMASYESITKLDNTINDATLIADSLKQIGFDVTLLTDSPLAELEAALKDFSFRSETADLALIYFAGHGIEVQGENFLVPVDAKVTSNRDVQAQSVSLKEFLSTVDRARKMRIVILDACRNNPFGDAIELTQAVEGGADDGSTRGAAGGMAAPSPDRGTLVAFAARDGAVALDGDGANSPFALALADRMRQPGLEISLMFRQVRDLVLDKTQNFQEPHTYGSLPGEPFFLAGLDGEGSQIDAPDVQTAWSQLPPGQEEDFIRLAAMGDTRSMVALGRMWFNPQQPALFKPDKAIEQMEKAAAAGDPEAIFDLAKIYEQGIFTQKDTTRALELYKKAADMEFGEALNNMGFFYAQGFYGLPVDMQTAASYFERAANVRHREAMYNYAAMINAGMIPGKGPAEAAGYLYSAIRAGSRRVFDAVIDNPSFISLETRKALQVKMSEFGFYDGPIDGDFGEGTKRAIRRAYGISE